MILTIEVLSIISLSIFAVIGIWSFIILNQIFNQLKYKNYLLEKLNLHIFNISQSFCKDTKSEEDASN